MAATVVGVSGSVAGASLAAEVVTGTGKFDATGEHSHWWCDRRT